MRSVLAYFLKPAIQIIGMLLLLCLSACHKEENYIPDKTEPVLPCKVQGACDATINRYIVNFNKSGITVITMGQDYLISIPAGALFPDQSPRILWSGYSRLNQVAQFLKQFRKIAITVTSYSSKYVSTQREHALTLARSRVVGEYLWTRGIDSRFIFTQGVGSDKPISSYTQGGDKSPNARVEITFRRAVA